MHACMCACTCTHACMCTRYFHHKRNIYKYTYIEMYTYTYTYTYIHMHTHTHTEIQRVLSSSGAYVCVSLLQPCVLTCLLRELPFKVHKCICIHVCMHDHVCVSLLQPCVLMCLKYAYACMYVCGVGLTCQFV